MYINYIKNKISLTFLCQSFYRFAMVTLCVGTSLRLINKSKNYYRHHHSYAACYYNALTHDIIRFVRLLFVITGTHCTRDIIITTILPKNRTSLEKRVCHYEQSNNEVLSLELDADKIRRRLHIVM